MAKMMSAKIDVNKIDKSKLFKGAKGTYLDVTIVLNDEADQFGNTVSIIQSQTKEERDAKSDKNYLGNGKVFWSSEGGNAPSKQAETIDDSDSLPF